MNSLWNKMMKDHFSYRPKYTFTASIRESKRPEEGATRTTLVEQKQVCVYPDPDDGKYTWEDTDGSS
jgi:hypothetical protein